MATNNTNDGAVWMHNAQAGKSSYAGGIVGYDYNTKDKSAVTGNVNNGAYRPPSRALRRCWRPGASSGATTWAPCPDAGISARWHVRCMRGRSWAGTRKAWRTAPAGGSVNGTALTGTNLCGTGGRLPGRGLVVGHHLRGEIARQIINYLTERNLL